MAGFAFLIFLTVDCLLFPCEGKVFAPSAGSTLTFARKSTESRIVWSFDDIIAPTSRRTWSFISTGQNPVVLAIIDGNDPVKIFSNLLEFAIEGKATLVLKNVNQTYNGTYQFTLTPSIGVGTSDVVVFIGDPPDNVKLKVTRSGKSANIICSAKARPPASFEIFLNETKLVSTENTYIIPDVNISHVGNYSCVAKNILGNKTSNIEYLVRLEASLPTHSTTISGENEVKTTRKDNEIETAPSNTTPSCQTEWYIVVVTLLAGIMIGIVFSNIVFCFRRKFRSDKPQPDSKLQNQVDSTYQELDLTKMNKEDNYQSLRVNAATNDTADDDDSNYAELSKTRESDVENNYQSLT